MSWQCASEIKSQILYRPTAEVPSGQGALVACRRRQAKVLAGLAARPALAGPRARGGRPFPTQHLQLCCSRWMKMQPVKQPDWEPGSDAQTARQTPWLRSALPCLAPGSAFCLASLRGRMGSSVRDRPRTCGAGDGQAESRCPRGEGERRGRGCEVVCVISRHRGGPEKNVAVASLAVQRPRAAAPCAPIEMQRFSMAIGLPKAREEALCGRGRDHRHHHHHQQTTSSKRRGNESWLLDRREVEGCGLGRYAVRGYMENPQLPPDCTRPEAGLDMGPCGTVP